MKNSIFTRILTASLIPMLFIFILLLLIIRNTIYSASSEYTAASIMLSAEQTMFMFESKIETIDKITKLAAENLYMKNKNSVVTKATVEQILISILKTNQTIHCAWLIFEPGVLSNDEKYSNSYIRGENGIFESEFLKKEKLKDLDLSKWYSVPFSTGEPYFNVVGLYDFNDGRGPLYTGTLSYPIFFNDQIVGCVGLDIVYNDFFKMLDEKLEEIDAKSFITSDDGEIIYPAIYSKMHISELKYDYTGNLMEAMQNGEAYIEEKESMFFGKISLLYMQPVDFELSDKCMYLIIDISSGALYKEAESSVQIVLIACIAGLLILSASMFFTARNIAKPIKKITKNALDIANGQLDVQFDVLYEYANSKNELVILQSALKKMLKEMNLSNELRMIVMEASFEMDKAQAESEAKNRYFANVSHEIRTPMNAILGMSELLEEENLTETQLKYVTSIKISSEALLSLINDILDLSKMESGSLELIPENYNFITFMDNINSIGKFLCEQKKLQYEYEFMGTPPRYLFGDDTRLRQVLMNIIGNAVKFTKEGSVRVYVEIVDNNLFFSVADTGLGIKENDLPELFSAFKRLDIAKNKNTPGTGLGLVITKNLVEMMDGVITVESIYGEGTVFHINIPMVLGDEVMLVAKEDSKGLFIAPEAKVLIVDDNEINLNVATGLLGLYKIQCETSLSGAEAIEKVQEKDYDIIFMDHMMPEMDGIEATKIIRELGGKYRILPIIALTANAVSGMKEKFISSGMSDFLSKPIVKGNLNHILSLWIPDNKKIEKSETHAVTNEERSAILIKAAEIEGLDIELGLSRIAMQQESYEKSLRLAAVKIPEFIKTVEMLLDDGALYQFNIQIHGMKGVLANIGAMRLSEKALEIENSSDDLVFSYEKLTAFLFELKNFGDSLHLLFNDTEPQKSSGDIKQLEDEMNTLLYALKDYDYQNAGDILEKLNKYDYGEKINSRIANLKEIVDQFDYDKAIEIIQKGMN